MTLLRFGIVPPAAPVHWNPAAETTFTLTPPPATKGLLSPITTPAPDAIRPLATDTLPRGDVWAAFVSGRFGNTNDLWLAHATGGVWREFLFTGKQYVSSQNYDFSGSGPQPGSCILQVSGDSVTIKPTNSQAVSELAALQAQLTTAEQGSGSAPPSATQIGALATKMQTLQQSVGPALNTTYHLSLATLKRDSDGDGLTDIVEARLRTDPHSPDTMHNGLRDGADQNPLVHEAPAGVGDSDRRQILQQIFIALYGSDSSVDPIVVVLDKDLQQAFHGAAARVLCMTSEEYTQSASLYSSLRCLQFGGPTDSTSSILRADGPCLYSEDGHRAEVHFWYTTPGQAGYRRMSVMLGGGSDDVAIFHRTPAGWQLDSIDKWQFRYSASLTSQIESAYGY